MLTTAGLSRSASSAKLSGIMLTAGAPAGGVRLPSISSEKAGPASASAMPVASARPDHRAGAGSAASARRMSARPALDVVKFASLPEPRKRVARPARGACHRDLRAAPAARKSRLRALTPA